ncbi:hypothetical protein [Pseudonocardia acidicola]|uniref:DUF2550 family protein n=1 Tax=Pseudonocardia acidicola TaxID=2724939 RepID=A0ABX1SA38_9PSEU|nr:hypothetical protein [Pseudonocardia acidicola]NMH97742.1 hypothetical protein [Pseudonocardia acidicola]
MPLAELVLIAAPLGVFGAAFLAPAVLVRRQFSRLPEAFECKVRAPDGRLAGLSRRGRWRRARAVWVHDVLLLRSGRPAAAVRPIAVRHPDGSVKAAPPQLVSRLGPAPVILRLRLDGGQLLEIAARREARSVIAGPFVVAAVEGLPSGSPERRSKGTT